MASFNKFHHHNKHSDTLYHITEPQFWCRTHFMCNFMRMSTICCSKFDNDCMALAIVLDSCFEHGFLRVMRDKPCDIFEFKIFTIGCKATEMGKQRRPLNFLRGSAW